MAKLVNDTESNGYNIIGVGTQIKGNINTNSDIRLDGQLIGNISTTGKVVVGENGMISGQINCKNADISGQIEGKIMVSELLSLKSTAKVFGDILINRLAVEPGCIFTGHCKMDAETEANVRFTETNKEESYEESKAVL